MGLTSSLRERVLALHDNHKRIAAGAALVGILTIGAKAVVAVREMAIAWRFGIGPVVDSYQLALTLATWLPMMLGGVMTVVLVPRLVTLKQRRDEYDEFVAELNATVLLIGLAIAIVTFLAAPTAAAMLASRGENRTRVLTLAMARALAPVAFLTILVAYLSARLQARERFTYTITEAVPALTIALLIILPTTFPGFAVLVSATLLGFLLQLILVCVLVDHGDTRIGAISFHHRSPAWRGTYRALLMMGVAQTLIMASVPIDQAFASRLGQGSVATLGYATRIITLLSGLATIVLGRALLPVLAEAAVIDEGPLVRRQAWTWSLLLLAFGAIAAAALWVAAPYLVRVLFQRGAFSSEASSLVAEALQFGLIQLPPYFAGIALVQWFAATDRFRAMTAITAAGLLAKLTLNLILAPRFGVPGIMLATAGMYTLTAILLALGTLSSSARRLPLRDSRR